MKASRMDRINNAAKKQSRPRESQLVSRAKDLINSIPRARCFKHHGNRFTEAGHSDLYGSVDGRSFYIEMKAPGGKLSELQTKFLHDMYAIGCIVGWTTDPKQAAEIVRTGVSLLP